MSYRLPAEWEPQEFVLLAWPNETTDWAPYLEEIRKTVAEMVRAIVRHEKVLLLSMFKSDVPDELCSLPNVYVAELPNNDTWAETQEPGTETDATEAPVAEVTAEPVGTIETPKPTAEPGNTDPNPVQQPNRALVIAVIAGIVVVILLAILAIILILIRNKRQREEN